MRSSLGMKGKSVFQDLKSVYTVAMRQASQLQLFVENIAIKQARQITLLNYLLRILQRLVQFCEKLLGILFDYAYAEHFFYYISNRKLFIRLLGSPIFFYLKNR